MFDVNGSNEIEEGCVKITFDPSSGKQCVTYVIDFGKTKLNPHAAADIVKKINEILKKDLGLSLEKFK